MRVLITDGNQRATLAVVRSLGSKGHRVVVGETTRTSLASRSRHCAEAVAYPPWDKDPRGFIEALEHMVGRGGFDLLLPMTDPTVFLVTRHRDALEKYARIPFPDHATFARASNKYEMYRLAVSLGVPVPRTAVLESAGGQVPDAAEDLGYPLVVKPHASWVEHGDGLTGFSVRFAADQEALADIMAGTPPEAYPLLLQEGISGSGIGYFCLFAGGKPLAEFFHRRIRERPAWGGESVLREAAAPDPALRAHSVALLSELGWTGPAMCEYKLDRRDGSPRLMEINGRFWGSLQLAIDAGVDFPDLLVRAIEGKSLSPDAGYRIGVRSRWLLGDADALLGVLAGSAPKGRPVPGRGRALWDFLRPSGPKTRLEAARIGDPGPFVYELSRFTSKLLRLVGGKLAGRLAPSRSRPFGMLHCHTTYSYDGEASPKQIVDFLRGLGARFLALNEHVQSMTPESVAQMVEECRRLSGPDFVVVPGLEYSLEGIGHVIALGLEDYIPNEGSPLEIIREIKRRGALPVLAHPYPGDPDPAPEILLELAGVETWNTLHDGGYVPRPASMDRIERYRKINPALRDFQGSDLHRFSSFKPVFVTIPPGPLTKERILDCLRSGTFRVRAKMISYRSLIETGPVKRAYIRAVFGLLERVRPLWRKARDRFGVPCWRYFGCSAFCT